MDNDMNSDSIMKNELIENEYTFKDSGEGYAFGDSGSGYTSFLLQENEFRLIRLFGMEMEENRSNPARIRGITDIFSSLGSSDSRLKSKEISFDGKCLRMTAELFGGALLYQTDWVLHDQTSIFVRKDSIRNCSSEPVTLQKALQRYIFQDTDLEAYTQHSSWCAENIGSWERIGSNGLLLVSEGGRTTQGAAPYLALRRPDKRGVVFHIIPTGNWKIQMSRTTAGSDRACSGLCILELGQSDDHFSLLLKPGEVFQYPVTLIQKLPYGKLSLAASALQKFFLDTDAGRNRIRHRVSYNPWFEHYALLDVDRLKEHLKAAKELGCEVFEIDAGWYGRAGGDWWSQSGDWTERADSAFCGKMKDFADCVRKEGLEFGLWMEPERIGKNVPIRKSHPEYFEMGEGYYYPKLYDAEVYEYIYREITGLIERYNLGWMKLDFNFELGIDPTGAEFFSYYEAWYRLLREIKTNYPDTFLEACAAGGMRNDINTSSAFDGHFLSDNVNAWDMQAVYEQCCLRLPHYRMIRWLVLSPGAKISLYGRHDTEKLPTVITPQLPGAGWDTYEEISPEFACQLIMSGPFGLSGNFIDLEPEQFAVIQKYVSFYKYYRDFLKDSVLFPGADPKNVGNREGFCHLQYSHEKTGNQLVYIYRFITSGDMYVLRLQRLEDNAFYYVTDALTTAMVAAGTGREFMGQGLPVYLKTIHSGKILFFEKAAHRSTE